MKDKQKFRKMLKQEEIEAEISKIGDFFNQIPDDLKAVAAEKFIYEIVNWGCRDHYQALGIFQEAMNTYREISLQILAEEAEEEELHDAFENAKDYRCLQEMDWMAIPIAKGEICRIGLVCEDDQYLGGKRYEVFLEDGRHFDICQHVLEEYFELVENAG